MGKKSILILILFVLFVFSFTTISATNNIQPVLQGAPETVTINFDDDSYLEYLFIAGMETASPSDFSIIDGIYYVDEQSGFNLPLETGSLIHYRVKSKTFAEDGPLFMMDLNNENRNEEAFRFYAMSSNDFYIDILTMDSFSNLFFDGVNTLSLDDWVDIVFYLSNNEELNVFLFSASNPSNYLYTSVALPVGWHDQRWVSNFFIDYGFWENQVDSNELSLMIDFINYSSLPAKDYFATYLPAYEKNQAGINHALDSGKLRFAELDFMSYENDQILKPFSEEDYPDYPATVDIDSTMETGGDDLERLDLNLPINLIHTVVENAQVVFEENAEAMRDNFGEQFSDISTKRYDEENDVFVFATENEAASLVFNTPLDEIDGIENESGKGFYFQFKPNAENLQFLFYDSNQKEIGIGFQEDGTPFLFNSATDQLIPFMSGETEPCTVLNDKWYHLFFAIDEDSYIKALIWPVDEVLHNGGFADFQFEGIDATNWNFMIRFDPNGMIEVSDYQIYSIENFPTMFEE